MPVWVLYLVMGVIFALLIVWMWYSGKKRKKQDQEAQDLINAVGPGNKVKTIGGICGIVVEVDKEENTFILETGSESTGKCYIKFDKQAIYQTDAVIDKAVEAASNESESASADESSKEVSAEESETEVKE